jgi:integrase/recombinase XerD
VNALDGYLADYLGLRRALVTSSIGRAACNRSSSTGSTRPGRGQITVELAIEWARLPEGVQAIQWAHRLGAVRGFASYLHAIDPGT